MILVDANILMYAAGAPHPHKEPCLRLLDGVATGILEAALDTEVLQELLHRYRAIARWPAGRQVYDDARRLFGVVLPVTAEIIDRARQLLDTHQGISARDALHAAVVVEHRLKALCSYAAGFDLIHQIRRVSPAELLT